jgi:hypothetical protein
MFLCIKCALTGVKNEYFMQDAQNKCQNAEGSLSLAVKFHVIGHNEAGENQHNACKALDFEGLAV